MLPDGDATTGVLGGLTAILAVVSGWLARRARQSGRIATTDADRLWAVMEEQLRTRDTRIVALETRSDEQSMRLAEADARERELGSRVHVLEGELARVNAERASERVRFETRLADRDARIEDLESKVDARELAIAQLQRDNERLEQRVATFLAGRLTEDSA